jgi:regulator of protease activity HflC (stomatin/prohibitin superfamily)
MIASTILNAASVLVRWIPIRFTVVHEYEQGVRWWKGRATKLISSPSVYIYVPWIGDITTETVTPQEIETNLQVIDDPNGKPRSISVGIQYSIVNLLLYETKVSNFDDSLLNLVERLACKAIQSGEKDPLPALKKEVRSQCREWGVKVHRLGFVNNAHVRPIHLLQSD